MHVGSTTTTIIIIIINPYTDTWWLPSTGTYCMRFSDMMAFNRKSRQERRELRNGIFIKRK